MSSNKLLFAAFVPIILLAGIGLFIRVIQYEPLIPDLPEETEKKLQVPIFLEDPIVGDKKAAKTIVAFEDFGCKSCAEQSKILDTILEKNPKSAKIVWKIMAITSFPQDSTEAGKYGFCANEQGRFDEFKKYAFENAENLTNLTLETIAKEMKLDEKKLEECLKSPRSTAYLDTVKNLGKLLNVQALPTMFIDNKQIQIPANEAGWKTLLGI